jgi:hypothetical protein
MLGPHHACGCNGPPFNHKEKSMTIRSLLAIASASVLCAGLVLSAHAQTKPAPTEQPLAAKDRAVAESAFAKVDANGDGKLTKDEAAKLPAIGAKFAELDKNKDGWLSLDEFGTGYVQPN